MARVEFSLRPSRWLLRYLWLLHAVMLVVIWCFSVAAGLQVLSTALVIVSGVITLRRWRRPPPILSVDNGQWHIRPGNGTAGSEAKLQSPCYISRWLVVIPMRMTQGPVRRVVVPFDSLQPDQYRRLKVQLQLSLM